MTNFTPRAAQFTRFALVIGLGLVGLSTAMSGAKAQEGTFAQRMACTSDAFRLCSSAIPDASAVRACMIANKTQLGPGCLATFRNKTASR